MTNLKKLERKLHKKAFPKARKKVLKAKVKSKIKKGKFSRYKDYGSFLNLEREIRTKGLKDYFKVKGVLYTQEEYDMDGRRVAYANKRTNKGFIVTTKDRYHSGMGDAKITVNGNWGFFRNDISYID